MEPEYRMIDGVWVEPVDEPSPLEQMPEDDWKNSIEAALIELATIIAGGE
jgi:hypothetical protein